MIGNFYNSGLAPIPNQEELANEELNRLEQFAPPDVISGGSSLVSPFSPNSISRASGMFGTEMERQTSVRGRKDRMMRRY